MSRVRNLILTLDVLDIFPQFEFFQYFLFSLTCISEKFTGGNLHRITQVTTHQPWSSYDWTNKKKNALCWHMSFLVIIFSRLLWTGLGSFIYPTFTQVWQVSQPTNLETKQIIISAIGNATRQSKEKNNIWNELTHHCSPHSATCFVFSIVFTI